MENNSRFKNAKGECTPYALLCGYIQQTERNKVQTTLWREGDCYHVRQHDFNAAERVFWDCFTLRELAKARRRYNKAVEQQQLQREKDIAVLRAKMAVTCQVATKMRKEKRKP